MAAKEIVCLSLRRLPEEGEALARRVRAVCPAGSSLEVWGLGYGFAPGGEGEPAGMEESLRFRSFSVRARAWEAPAEGLPFRLRLWQEEPGQPRELTARPLPRSSREEEERLRQRQQYLLCGAGANRLWREEDRLGRDRLVCLDGPETAAAALELLCLLCREKGCSFEEAAAFCRETLVCLPGEEERRSIDVFRSELPHLYPFVLDLEERICLELKARGVYEERQEPFRILGGSRIFLGRLAGALSRPRASRE